MKKNNNQKSKTWIWYIVAIIILFSYYIFKNLIFESLINYYELNNSHIIFPYINFNFTYHIISFFTFTVLGALLLSPFIPKSIKKIKANFVLREKNLPKLKWWHRKSIALIILFVYYFSKEIIFESIIFYYESSYSHIIFPFIDFNITYHLISFFTFTILAGLFFSPFIPHIIKQLKARWVLRNKSSSSRKVTS
jgi:hypothetical protein